MTRSGCSAAMALVVFGKFAASSCPSPVDANVKLPGTRLGVLLGDGVKVVDGTVVFVLVGVKVREEIGVLPGVGVDVGVIVGVGVGVQAYSSTKVKTGRINFFICASYRTSKR
jgi:hypothetical protein